MSSSLLFAGFRSLNSGISDDSLFFCLLFILLCSRHCHLLGISFPFLLPSAICVPRPKDVVRLFLTFWGLSFVRDDYPCNVGTSMWFLLLQYTRREVVETGKASKNALVTSKFAYFEHMAYAILDCCSVVLGA